MSFTSEQKDKQKAGSKHVRKEHKTLYYFVLLKIV